MRRTDRQQVLQFTCYPVGQKDGGRHITQKAEDGLIVYQVKWSKNAVTNPLAWLTNAVTREANKIKAQSRPARPAIS